MSVDELPQTAGPVPTRLSASLTSAEIEDRRRPGRPTDVSPQLVALLRNPAHADTVAPFPDTPHESGVLAPVMGIIVGVGLSIPLWAIIGGVVWALLR